MFNFISVGLLFERIFYIYKNIVLFKVKVW